MTDIKHIPIPADVADELGARFAALRATVECISASIAEEDGIAGSASEALEGVVAELERIYCDLDVCAWGGVPARPKLVVDNS